MGLKKFVDDPFFDIPKYSPCDEKPVLVPKDQEAKEAANKLRTIVPQNEGEYKKAKERFLYGLANPTETTKKITIALFSRGLKALDRNYMYYGGAEYFRYTFFFNQIEGPLKTIETVLNKLAQTMYNNAKDIEQNRDTQNWSRESEMFFQYSSELYARAHKANTLLQDLEKDKSQYIEYLEYYANK